MRDSRMNLVLALLTISLSVSLSPLLTGLSQAEQIDSSFSLQKDSTDSLINHSPSNEHIQERGELITTVLSNSLLIFIVLVFSIFVLLFVFIPFKKVFKSAQNANEGEVQNSYEDRLIRYSHIVFTGVAFFLAALIATAALLNSFYLKNYFGIIPSKSSYDNQVSHVLSITDTMFSFFGLVVALVAASGAVFGWWLRNRVELAIEEAGNVKSDSDRFKTKLEGVNHRFDKQIATCVNSIILSADMALMHLPSITFTQQIPANLVRTLYILENIFIFDVDG